MIGQRLAVAISRKDISQNELSRRIGVVPSLISMYLSDEKTPSPNKLIKLSKELDCSIDYLLGISDDIKGSKITDNISDDEIVLIINDIANSKLSNEAKDIIRNVIRMNQK